MGAHHGKKSAIYIGTGTPGTPVFVPFIADYTLDKSVDTVEVTSFQSTNKEYVQGLPNLAGNFSGFFDSAQDMIFDASESQTPVTMIIYPATDVPTNYHIGPAWISAQMASGIAAAVTMTGSFVAAGSWQRFPTT